MWSAPPTLLRRVGVTPEAVRRRRSCRCYWLRCFFWGWSILVPGVLMVIMGLLYWRYTQDCPAGNFSTLRATGLMPDNGKKAGWSSFKQACSNYRVWMLFMTYAACFGVEIFIHNMAALHYVDGRTGLLFVLILGEGLGLLWFAQAPGVTTAIFAMITFGLFTHMACGATYALVPFIDHKALGGVAGIIGAGGNVGAVAAGFLMKGTGDTQQTLLILGTAVCVTAVCAIAVRFSPEHKSREQALYEEAVQQRSALA